MTFASDTGQVHAITQEVPSCVLDWKVNNCENDVSLRAIHQEGGIGLCKNKLQDSKFKQLHESADTLPLFLK